MANLPEDFDGGKDDFSLYCKKHYREIIVYVVFVIGLIWFFFNPLFGGLIIGAIAGIYFGDQLIAYFNYCKNNIAPPDILRHLILGGIALAFFVAAPTIFLGAAAAIIIKEIFVVKQ